MGKQIAIVATMIGQGTKTHLVTAEVKADGYYQNDVACGSKSSNNPFRRSMQHGNIVLTETVEMPELYNEAWIAARLELDKEALANLSDMSIPTLCAKCEKDIKRAISFRSELVASSKAAAN